MNPTLADPVVLMLGGWLVWDGLHVRRGEVVETAVEFWHLGKPRVVDDAQAPALAQVDGCRYAVTARVREAGEVVVLDLGAFTVLRWQPLGSAVEWVVGSTVELELGLGLSPWFGDASLARVHAEHAEHDLERRWFVEAVTRHDEPAPHCSGVPLEEATSDTVTSSAQHCLVTCRPR